MFTGIIKSTGFVVKLREYKKEYKIQVEASKDMSSNLKAGDSVAVDGICLTLEQISATNIMHFHLGIETLKITNYSPAQLKGKKVNLEPALRVGDFFGGHFVTGHVDGMAEVLSFNQQGASALMELKTPAEFKSFFWPKGFIALNGASLTLNAVKDSCLKVCLVPETLKRSNLLGQKPGSLLTFEADYLARGLFKAKAFRL